MQGKHTIKQGETPITLGIIEVYSVSKTIQKGDLVLIVLKNNSKVLTVESFICENPLEILKQAEKKVLEKALFMLKDDFQHSTYYRKLQH